jgi:signal transduction histidine kinase
MLLFTIVFCLLIHQNIKEKRDVSIAYLNRMASMLIFSIEQNSDYREILSDYENSSWLHYSFRLFSDTDSFLYQSENLEDCSAIIDTFLDTLQHHSGYALSPLELKDCVSSGQSAAYTISMPDGKNYDCIFCEIVTGYGITYGLFIVKESDSFASLLLPELKFYICIWLGVFLFIIFLSQVLTRITIKPTEAAIQSQKDFIAAVSHECKAPLAAILSSAEMIAAIPDTSDSVKDHVHVIDLEVSRMSRLIQDLLLLSSIDAGNWSFHMEEINIDTLLINLYTKFEQICRKKNILLQLNISDECFPPLYSDADRLNQIISIFLDNAVSYSPSESEISLNAFVEKNELIITIIDHGIGISNKDKPFIFNRFYQCDKSRTQREHFGLGLSIANELVNKLEGRIRLFDTSGGGCTFKIFLPIK